MDITQFDYDLPDDLIAQKPSANREDSRLLYVDDVNKNHHFSNLVELINAGDLLIINDTMVLPARLIAKKSSGGRVEILLERFIDDNHIYAQLGSNKKIKMGQDIILGDIVITVIDKIDNFYKLRFNQAKAVTVFEQYGEMPLPPYIKRKPEYKDIERYQTVYAKNKGAVAAPTAGLHFDNAMFEKLKQKKINIASLTLHVGAGTFQPVRCKNITEHKMHKEFYNIDDSLIDRITSTRRSGNRVIAVGTTSVRALESAYLENKLTKPLNSSTNLYITPGFEFNVVDAMITNFHLPRSTLLMLVCAFAGYEKVMDAYKFAIDQKYRFFSYGDAMFLTNSKKINACNLR